MMWPISKGTSSYSWAMWQNSQQPAARCETCCASAAGMRMSGERAFLGFDLESAAGFGFEDAEEAAGFGVGEQFFLLCRRQRIFLVAHGQVMHTGLVLLAETQVENVA